MVKILFLVAPFKAAFMKRMCDYFNAEVEADFYIASHVQYERKELGTRLTQRFIGPRELHNRLKNNDYDLVYSDNAFYAAQLKLLALMNFRRVPHIMHLRRDWWSEFKSAYREVADTLPRKIYMKQSYLYQWFGLATARKITPICGYLDQVVKKHFPFKRTEVVYQGIDPDLFVSSAPPLELQRPAVAIIQNHSIYNKTLGLIGFAQVAKALPNFNFYISTGETTGRKYLDRVRGAFEALPNVYFMDDVVSPQRVCDLLNSCDVYALPSGQDMFPTTILEAGLLGKPVVASNVGGIPEIIKEGGTGWLANNGDVEDWAAKLRTALTWRNGATARQYIIDRFSWAVIVKQVARIILEEAHTHQY